jgi:hypothetical protein
MSIPLIRTVLVEKQPVRKFRFMNKIDKLEDDDDMLPEYDFTGGVRGKHYQAYRRGHSVQIFQEDGTVEVQHFVPEDNVVKLDSDVQQCFPDSASVNHALRTLIQLVPQK